MPIALAKSSKVIQYHLIVDYLCFYWSTNTCMPMFKSPLENIIYNIVFDFQMCPTHSIRWIVCKIQGKWPYSSGFVEFCFQDLFKTERSILLSLISTFFYSECFLKVRVVLIQLQSGSNPVSFEWSDFHLTIAYTYFSVPFLCVYWCNLR